MSEQQFDHRLVVDTETDLFGVTEGNLFRCTVRCAGCLLVPDGAEGIIYLRHADEEQQKPLNGVCTSTDTDLYVNPKRDRFPASVACSNGVAARSIADNQG